MQLRPALAIAAALALGLPALSQEGFPARLSSKIVWSMDSAGFGGWSGLELSSDGRRFLAVSDRGSLIAGEIRRDGAGRIRGLATGRLRPIPRADGQPVSGRFADAEGLAFSPGGDLFVSFEGRHRIARFSGWPPGRAENLPGPPAGRLKPNGSFEALAMDEAGALYTLPEDPDDPAHFPVYRFKNGQWSLFSRIRRSGGFLAVGADIGPDGRFYVLERRLVGPFGFATRVRRFDLTPGGLAGETVLLRTKAGTHDNLEGLAVWRDDAGKVRLTMVADDNFRFFQTTQIVEYVIEE